MTDHSKCIKVLRDNGTTADLLAADLLELHDRTSLSLDDWQSATDFVRKQLASRHERLGMTFTQIWELPVKNGV